MVSTLQYKIFFFGNSCYYSYNNNNLYGAHDMYKTEGVK